jgi:hypothetical protein
MSEIALAVLEMPDELFWADDPLYRNQHNACRKEAAAEIRKLRAIVENQAEAGARGEAETLDQICDLLGIGASARKPSIIMTNLKNIKRFSDFLRAVEAKFFMVEGEPDEDSPDETPESVCLVNSWGSTKDQYLEDFARALDIIRPPAPAIPDGYALMPTELSGDNYRVYEASAQTAFCPRCGEQFETYLEDSTWEKMLSAAPDKQERGQ